MFTKGESTELFTRCMRGVLSLDEGMYGRPVLVLATPLDIPADSLHYPAFRTKRFWSPTLLITGNEYEYIPASKDFFHQQQLQIGLMAQWQGA
jgi:hypothetical protein